MSRKRRNTSSPETSPSPPPPRKQPSSPIDDVFSDEDPQADDEKPRVSGLFGQTGAFPGLGGDDNTGELFYGPASDGIGYLRMVRSEARNVPNLLVAPRAFDATDASGDHGKTTGGHWEDETYIAAPRSEISDPERRLSSAQLRYYGSLLAQFQLLRATLRCTPPLAAVKTLPSDRLIYFPADSQKAWDRWERQVIDCNASMVQIASMDMDSTWELIKMLNELLSDGEDNWQRLGAWAWAALGKCPELGMCVSEEVSELRALARRAIELLDGRDAEIGQNEGHIAGTTSRFGAGQLVTVNATREMALDMIVTIVGEVYGQRDLLEQRRIWRPLDS